MPSLRSQLNFVGGSAEMTKHEIIWKLWEINKAQLEEHERSGTVADSKKVADQTSKALLRSD